MNRAATEQITGELAISDEVVALAGLHGRLGGISRLMVRRGAIITPAVRDLLRDKKIELITQASAENNVNAIAGKTRLLLGVANTNYRPAELLRVLGREPIAIEQPVATGFNEHMELLTAAVSTGDTLGMLLTEETAAALCLANRHGGVRAIAATDSRGVADGVRAIGANLLVVHPRGRTLFEMKRIVSQFCAGGPRICPELWRGRL